jgi:hypothetical protein
MSSQMSLRLITARIFELLIFLTTAIREFCPFRSRQEKIVTEREPHELAG